MKDFGCDRDRLLQIWRRNKDSLCVVSRKMNNIAKVENLSTELFMKHSFNLNHMSTEAILVYIYIKDPALKLKVLKKMEIALKTDICPITGGKFGYYGLTERIMKDLVELCDTGGIAPKPRPAIPLSTRDIDMLAVMKSRAIAASKTDGERAAIASLHNKILGIASIPGHA